MAKKPTFTESKERFDEVKEDLIASMTSKKVTTDLKAEVIRSLQSTSELLNRYAIKSK